MSMSKKTKFATYALLTKEWMRMCSRHCQRIVK